MTVSKSGASLLLTTWERHRHTVISVMVGLRSENTHIQPVEPHTHLDHLRRRERGKITDMVYLFAYLLTT